MQTCVVCTKRALTYTKAPKLQTPKVAKHLQLNFQFIT